MKDLNLPALPSLSRLRLAFEIALWRYRWRLPLLVGALLLLAGVALWLPLQFALLASANAAFERDGERPAGQLHAAVAPLEQFRQALVMQDATPTQLRVIHQKASELGLSPGQLDMRRQSDAAGIFSQLQLTMPLRGSYPAIKRFCGDVLEYMPSVSIDQITIKRDEAHPGQVEAQVVMSLWQHAQPSRGDRP